MDSRLAAASARRVAGHLAVPVLAVVLAALTVTPRRGPVVAPDEMGYLAGARAIAGAGTPLDMAGLPFYPIGWPALAAVPARLFAGDAATTYTSTVVVQIVLLAATAIVAMHLARSLLRVGLGVAGIAAAVGVTTPSAIVTTRFVWSETFVTFWVTATAALLVASYRCAFAGGAARRRDAVVAAATGVAVGWMPFAHGRLMAGALGVVLVTVAVLITRRRWSSLGWFVGGVVLAAVVGQALSTFVRSTVWDDRARSNVAATRRGVSSPSDLWQTLQLAGGQTWAFLIGSFGLGAVAVWVASATFRRDPEEGGSLRARLLGSPERCVALAGLVVLAGTLLTSAAFFTGSVFRTGENRQDHLLYGRYLDAVQPLVVTIGLTVVLDAARRRRSRRVAELGIVAAASIVVTTVFVEVTGTTELTDSLPFNPFTALNLARTGPEIGRAAVETVVALGASIAGLVLVASCVADRWSPRRAGVAVAVCTLPLVGANLVRWHDAAEATDGVDYADALAVVEHLESVGVTDVRFDRSIWLGDRLVVQYWMPQLTAERVSLPTEIGCDGETAVVTHATAAAAELVAGRLAVVRCDEPGAAADASSIVEPVVAP